MEKSQQKLIVIVGPTASGKSDLAVKLAKKYNGEIISADSRQIYKGMDIGTGKITSEEMDGIPHHLLDVTSPNRVFTVAQYQKLGSKAIKKIISIGKLPIIAGGTGFYIDALITNSTLPNVKPDLMLRKKLNKLTAEKLFNMLEKLDTKRASAIDPYNKYRLIRALEIITTTGKPVPEVKISSDYKILKIGIMLPNTKLRKLIHKRLLARIKQGLIEEVKNLHNSKISWRRLDELGLEYRYVSKYLRGLMTKQEMLEKLETEIWHYSKRQMTWFKKDKSIHWITKKNQSFKLVRDFLG